jgi:hypothetical protein
MSIRGFSAFGNSLVNIKREKKKKGVEGKRRHCSEI